MITVPCDENLIDVSTQTTKPVTCACGDVLQKLDMVLDNLRDLRDDLAMQSCDLSEIRKRCLSIEKQMEHVNDVSWHHLAVGVYLSTA